jgi:hypothetical protein
MHVARRQHGEVSGAERHEAQNGEQECKQPSAAFVNIGKPSIASNSS